MSATSPDILERVQGFASGLYDSASSSFGNAINGLKEQGITATTKDVAVGVIKGNTADLVGTPVDIINTLVSPVTKAMGIYTDNPIGGSKNIRTILGMEAEDKNIAETAGSMISVGGAAKAMIVSAARLGKVNKAVDVGGAIELSIGGKVPMAEIYNKTGAYAETGTPFKSVMSDKNAKLNMDTAERIGLEPKDQGITYAKLNELLDHPELFKAYPELKNTNVYIDRLPKGYKGQNFVEDKRIVLQRDGMSFAPGYNQNDDTLSTLLHEVQHSIQGLDKTQSGGNVKQFLQFNPAAAQEKINTARATGDKSQIDAAERFKAVLNNKVQEAHTKYSNLAGEQEARFTQFTRHLSEEELASNVLNMLRNGNTPATWDTKAIPTKNR